MTDIDYSLRPDTRTSWAQISPAVLTNLDRLAQTLPPAGWQIELHLDNAHLTARPATKDAA